MTLVLNRMTRKEAQARRRRVGWWQWPKDDVQKRGIRMAQIDLTTMKPLKPYFMIEGRDYASGAFLGWVNEMEDPRRG